MMKTLTLSSIFNFSKILRDSSISHPLTVNLMETIIYFILLLKLNQFLLLLDVLIIIDFDFESLILTRNYHQMLEFLL